MSDDADSKIVLTPAEKAITLVFAIAGYMVGWYVRAQMGLVGAVPGAIAGALGTGGGFAVGMILVLVLRSASRK